MLHVHDLGTTLHHHGASILGSAGSFGCGLYGLIDGGSDPGTRFLLGLLGSITVPIAIETVRVVGRHFADERARRLEAERDAARAEADKLFDRLTESLARPRVDTLAPEKGP